jgi:hypothetical protein
MKSLSKRHSTPIPIPTVPCIPSQRRHAGATPSRGVVAIPRCGHRLFCDVDSSEQGSLESDIQQIVPVHAASAAKSRTASRSGSRIAPSTIRFFVPFVLVTDIPNDGDRVYPDYDSENPTAHSGWETI